MRTHTAARDGSGTARTRFVIAAAIMAAAVTVGAFASTAAASGSNRPSKQTAVRLDAFEPWDEGGTTEVDNGEPGFGPGDQVVEHHRLLDPASGDEIGRVTKEITVLETAPDGDFLFMVHSELTFARGTVQDSGSLWFSEVERGTAVVAATGGTGAYAHSTGTVRGALGERAGNPGLFLTIDITRSR
jgi:hypothetical protein